MHVGKQYRTVLRRDFPTDEPFPNLWPWRCWFDFFAPDTGIEDELFQLLSTQSSVGLVTDIGSAMRYDFRFESGFNFWDMRWETNILTHAGDHVYRWLFTSFDKAGFALVTAHGFGLSRNSDYWNFDGVFPPGTWSWVGDGDYPSVPSTTNLVVRFSYVDWSSLPPGEQHPH